MQVWSKMDFGTGEIIFLDITQKEDMLQVEYPNCFLLDMGWYQDRYIISIIQNFDWTHPVQQYDVGNHFSPTVVAAAITSRKAKNSLPTHILLENVPGLAPTSLLLLEQLRTIDRKRLRGYIGRISKEKMLEVDAALAISIGIGYPNERRTHNV